MIGIEWDVPASLTTNAGTLTFNSFPGLILDPQQCSATKIIRASVDPIPTGDGDILHTRYQTGYTYKLVVLAFDSHDSPSCGSDARLMFEELALHLYAMLRSPGRYCWQPSNYGDKRALDYVFWLEGVTQSFNSGIWQAEFSFDSPYPYAIDLTQTISTISGVSGSITNSGNTDFYPVIKVNGPTSAFVIGNATTGQAITYDSANPGASSILGGDYAEISTFNGTIYLNGNGADLSAGFDPTLSSFILVLSPGANSVFSTGASSDWLINNAWG